MQESRVNPAQISRHAKGLPPIWSVVQSYGISMEQCLEGTGVTRDQALGEESGFTLSHEFDLYRNILRLCGDPLVGLRLGSAYRPETFGILGYASLSAKNIQELTEVTCEFAELSYTHFRFRTSDDRGYFGAEFEIVYPLPADLLQIYCDRDIQSAFTLIQSVGVRPSALTEIRFIHNDEAHRTAYEKHFGCPVKFGQSSNAIFADPKLRNVALPLSNQEASHHTRAACEEMLKEIHAHNTLKSEIIELLLDSPGTFPSLEDISEKLGISSRNLRRKLKDEDASYQEILKEVRLELAKQYLGKGVTVEAVAELLDYSEISTFSRAFKSWTGQSPRQYRNR